MHNNRQAHSPKVHSPYAFPAIAVGDMHEANRTYYESGCSSSNSEADNEAGAYPYQQEYGYEEQQQPQPQQQQQQYFPPQQQHGRPHHQHAQPQGPPGYHQTMGAPAPNPPSYTHHGQPQAQPQQPQPQPQQQRQPQHHQAQPQAQPQQQQAPPQGQSQQSSAPQQLHHPTTHQSLQHTVPNRSRSNSTPESEVSGASTMVEHSSSVPEGVFHRGLAEHCEFIRPPPLPATDVPTPTYPCHRLFLGQIRFETTSQEVQWLIEYLVGVHSLKIETRGTGCFLAYFKTWDDMCKVRTMHKRILFDHTGVWYARSAAQGDIMQNYVKANLTHIGRGFRLPKDMMVVEEEKLVRPLPIPACPPQYQHFPPPAQHQYPSYNRGQGGPYGDNQSDF